MKTKTAKVSLYEFILHTFREGIANLTPLQGYVSLQSIALDLALGRFSEINATIGFSAVSPRGPLSRSETLSLELSNAYSDFLQETLILLIASSYRITETLPKRVDLIDGGYSQAEFLSFCQSLYEKHRYQFFTSYEQVARRSGTMIL